MATRIQILDQENNEVLPITDTESVRNPQNIGGTLESRLEVLEEQCDNIPAISTNIETDATSETKAAAPKAVKTYVDSKVSSAYKAAGTASSVSNLGSLDASHEGFVYNMSAEFTTTADFVEGAGKTYPAGTNVAIVNVGTAQSTSYKYDVIAGFVDLSGKADKSEMSVTDGTGADADKTTIQLKNGTSATVLKQHQSLEGYVQRSGNYTENNFASFDSNGGLQDSGKKATDFATAAQGAKADSAIQGITKGGTPLDPDGNKVVDVPVDIVSAHATQVSYTQPASATIDQDKVLQLEIPQGTPGHNPNLGTFDISAISNAPTPTEDGDYIVVIDANAVSPRLPKEIYLWNGSVWTATGEAPTATFATGEVVSNVNIINDRTTGGAGNVLSAEQGKVLKQELTQLDGKLIKLTGFGGLAQHAGATQVGDIFYNSSTRELNKLTATPNTSVPFPFYDGAIYTLNNRLYIWDGLFLVECDKPEQILDESINLLNPEDTDVVNHYYLNSSGGLGGGSADYCTSGFIRVTPGTVYYLRASGRTDQARYVAFYDSALSYVANSFTQNATSVTAPTGAAYMRLTYQTDSGANWWARAMVTTGGYKVYSAYFQPVKQEAVPVLGGNKIEEFAISNDKIANETIAPEKTTFIRSINLVDKSTANIGKYLTVTGNLGNNSDYNTTDYIIVFPGVTYYLTASGYTTKTARWVAFYDSSKSFIGSLLTNQASCEAPSGAAYMRATYSALTGNDDYWTYVQITKGEIKAYTEYSFKIDGSLVPEQTVQSAFHFLRNSETVSANGVTTLSYIYVLKDSTLSARIVGAIDSGGVAIGVGYYATGIHRDVDAMWVVIKPSEVELWSSDSGVNTQRNTYSHGLTLTGDVYVSIVKGSGNNANDGKLRIVTGLGEMYETTLSVWYGVGTPFVENNTAASVDVELSFSINDLTKKVWLIGDSYLSYYSTSRWPYYLIQSGFTSYLLNARPGMGPAKGYVCLQNLLATGCKPSFVVWLHGMNGAADVYDSGTSTYVIADSQKTYIDNVKALCDANNITLVLATIPSIPTKRLTGFNEYVKSLGVRYIDFSDAVGAQADGTWNTGLISSDNQHPSVAGAKVLFARAITDCPELTIQE